MSATDHVMTLADRIAEHRYTVNNEAELQAAIADVLDAAGQREHRLTDTERPDFLIDGIAIECKVAGTQIAALRQCQRYARHDDVQAVLLVTTKAAHDAGIHTLGSKPFHTLIVKGGWA